MWPEIKTAEDEVIARITNTCKALGVEVILINTAGGLVSKPETKITSTDVDFVIHLHFETPKTYDAFSFVTLWNPLQFYFDWGYKKHSNNIISHDDFLSCSSQCADDHVNRQILSDKTHLEPYFNLYHSLSTPICKPSLGNKKLFYVGINWEKLGKATGRHQDLLQSLDKSGDLVIYGPEIFQGVRVWEGFNSYVGSLPFDGESVINAISEAGITLVLSSEAHIESELMSNRLFEGLAAGSVIIVDENNFAQKHFGDLLLYIETSGKQPHEITMQVQQHLKWINEHQTEALEMATKAQQIFKEKFNMTLSIEKIYKELPVRKQNLAESFLHKTSRYSLNIIGFLSDYSEDALNHLVGSFSKQTYQNKKLVVLLDASEYKVYKKQIDKISQQHKFDVKQIDLFKRTLQGELIGTNKIGKYIYEVMSELSEGELVSILPQNESLFSEHYSSLVRSFEDNDDLELAYTNALITYQDNAGKQFFDVSDKVRPFNNEYNQPNGYSRFLIKVKHNNWMKPTLKYMGWWVIDAIYSKSSHKIRIARSSCTIDMQKLPFQSSAMSLVERDKALTIDTMTIEEQRYFALATVSDHYVNNFVESKINFADYSISERRHIINNLFESLGVPKWLKSAIVKTYRFLKQ